jgi:hypothetical protein
VRGAIEDPVLPRVLGVGVIGLEGRMDPPMGPLPIVGCAENAAATSVAANTLRREHIFPSWRRAAVEKELFGAETERLPAIIGPIQPRIKRRLLNFRRLRVWGCLQTRFPQSYTDIARPRATLLHGTRKRLCLKTQA